MEDLAASMLRLFLADLVLCQDDLQQEDIRFWSIIHNKDGADRMIKEITAYYAAKRRVRKSRAGNPSNVVAVFLYNASHTATRDRETTEEWRAKLDDGYSLAYVTRRDQTMELIEGLKGSYLTAQDIGRLVGHPVNINRVVGLVKEEYQRLEGV